MRLLANENEPVAIAIAAVTFCSWSLRNRQSCNRHLHLLRLLFESFFQVFHWIELRSVNQRCRLFCSHACSFCCAIFSLKFPHNLLTCPSVCDVAIIIILPMNVISSAHRTAHAYNIIYYCTLLTVVADNFRFRNSRLTFTWTTFPLSSTTDYRKILPLFRLG